MGQRQPYKEESCMEPSYAFKPRMIKIKNVYFFPMYLDRLYIIVTFSFLTVVPLIYLLYKYYKTNDVGALICFFSVFIPLILVILTFSFSGVYLISNRILYFALCLFGVTKFNSIKAIVIVNTVKPLVTSLYSSNTDECKRIKDIKTKTNIYTAFIVRKYSSKMSQGYYNSMTFQERFLLRCFPVIYQEKMIKLLLEKNPNIRIINKTMGELKIPFLENLENKEKQ